MSGIIINDLLKHVITFCWHGTCNCLWRGEHLSTHKKWYYRTLGKKERHTGYLFYVKIHNVIKRGKRNSEIDKMTMEGRKGKTTLRSQNLSILNLCIMLVSPRPFFILWKNKEHCQWVGSKILLDPLQICIGMTCNNLVMGILKKTKWNLMKKANRWLHNC